MIQYEDDEKEFEDCEWDLVDVVEQENTIKTIENVKISYHAMLGIVSPKN